MAYDVNGGPYMERDVTARLAAWKESPFRKPLIVRGARRVGKTRVLKYFGAEHYANVAYFSLEKINASTPSEYPQFFEITKDPRRIDFLVQLDNRVVPVEVKSGINAKSPGLRYYAGKYPDATPLRVRFSQCNLSFVDGVLNVPLYQADQAARLLRLALEG